MLKAVFLRISDLIFLHFFLLFCYFVCRLLWDNGDVSGQQVLHKDLLVCGSLWTLSSAVLCHSLLLLYIQGFEGFQVHVRMFVDQVLIKVIPRKKYKNKRLLLIQNALIYISPWNIISKKSA